MSGDLSNLQLNSLTPEQEETIIKLVQYQEQFESPPAEDIENITVCILFLNKIFERINFIYTLMIFFLFFSSHLRWEKVKKMD